LEFSHRVSGIQITDAKQQPNAVKASLNPVLVEGGGEVENLDDDDIDDI